MSTTQLQPGTLLQNGKYRVLEVLGKGGFGITYLAEQVMLQRKVAIKEFFLQEFCGRDEATLHMTIGTASARETVDTYRDKFLKEARNLATLKHPNIVSVFDVFLENNTAYYAMDYIEGGSLSARVKAFGYLPEPMATRLITEVASALAFIHDRNMMHLDVKPGNIMLDANNTAVLIDFGLSKQYDIESGNQTSTTPIGITDGYAPIEQYRRGGVSSFSPETDIYALGATFFYMLTGITPPCAADINEYGVPVGELQAKGVSPRTINVICSAMKSRKSDRMKDARSFVSCLQESTPPPIPTSVTTHNETTKTIGSAKKERTKIQANNRTQKIMIAVFLAILCIACALIGYFYLGSEQALKVAVPTDSVAAIDSAAIDSVSIDTIAVVEEPEPEPVGPDREAIYRAYTNAINHLKQELHGYYVFDLTGDGIPELILCAGTCHADTRTLVYTYQNNQLVEAVVTGGDKVYLGSNYIIGEYAGNGLFFRDKVSYRHGRFIKKRTEGDLDSDEYNIQEPLMPIYDDNNKTPIRRALGI